MESRAVEPSGAAYARLSDDEDLRAPSQSPSKLSGEFSSAEVQPANLPPWHRRVYRSLRRSVRGVVPVPVRLVFMLLSVSQEMPVTAIGYILTNDLKFGPEELSSYYLVTYTAWLFKPLYGFVSDNFPILGYRRRPYIMIFSVVTAFIFFAMSTWAHDHLLFTVLGVANAAAICFAEVMMDGVSTELGNELKHKLRQRDANAILRARRFEQQGAGADGQLVDGECECESDGEGLLTLMPPSSHGAIEGHEADGGLLSPTAETAHTMGDIAISAAPGPHDRAAAYYDIRTLDTVRAHDAHGHCHAHSHEHAHALALKDGSNAQSHGAGSLEGDAVAAAVAAVGTVSSSSSAADAENAKNAALEAAERVLLPPHARTQVATGTMRALDKSLRRDAQNGDGNGVCVSGSGAKCRGGPKCRRGAGAAPGVSTSGSINSDADSDSNDNNDLKKSSSKVGSCSGGAPPHSCSVVADANDGSGTPLTEDEEDEQILMAGLSASTARASIQAECMTVRSFASLLAAAASLGVLYFATPRALVLGMMAVPIVTIVVARWVPETSRRVVGADVTRHAQSDAEAAALAEADAERAAYPCCADSIDAMMAAEAAALNGGDNSIGNADASLNAAGAPALDMSNGSRAAVDGVDPSALYASRPRRPRVTCCSCRLIGRLLWFRTKVVLRAMLLLARPVIFMFVANAMPTSTDSYFGYMYSLSYPVWMYSFFTFVSLLGALLGSMLYWKGFSRISLRKVFVIATALSLVASIPTLLFVSGYAHDHWGISHKVAAPVANFFGAVFGRIVLMPTVVLAAESAPPHLGLESTMFSVFTSVSHAASFVSYAISVAFIRYFKLTWEDYSNLTPFMLVCMAFTLVPLLGLPILPRANEEDLLANEVTVQALLGADAVTAPAKGQQQQQQQEDLKQSQQQVSTKVSV